MIWVDIAKAVLTGFSSFHKAWYGVGEIFSKFNDGGNRGSMILLQNLAEVKHLELDYLKPIPTL